MGKKIEENEELSEKIIVTKSALQSTEIYSSARGYIITAQRQVYTAVNSAMVAAYWNIGKLIYEASGENDRAGYGKQLLQYLSEKLTREFGKGYDERNLRYMRQFYLTFVYNALKGTRNHD